MKNFILLLAFASVFTLASCQQVNVAPQNAAEKNVEKSNTVQSVPKVASEPGLALPLLAVDQMVLLSSTVTGVTKMEVKTALEAGWTNQTQTSFASLPNSELKLLLDTNGWEKVPAVCWEIETWVKKIPGDEKAWFTIHLSQERQNHGYVKRWFVQRCIPQKGEIAHSDEVNTIAWSGVEGFYRPLD